MSIDELPKRLIDAALRAGADAADAMAVSARDIAVSVRDDALEEANAAESSEFGLRVLIGARQACVSASDPRDAVIEELAARAVAMARAAPEDPYCGLLPLAQTGAATNDLALSDDAPDPAPAALEALARAAEQAALATPDVRACESAAAAFRRSRIALATSAGFAGAYERATASLSCSAIAGTGVGMEADYAWEARRRLADLPDPREIGARAGARAAARLGARKPPKGAWPVIYDRRVAGGLIGHLVSAANGAAVARGRSWLRDGLGEVVLPETMTLLEDPLIPAGPASRPFDGEGAPARAAPLVEKGRLARWLLDSASARQLELETTGNARRGLSAPPSPGATNLRLTPGDKTQAQLMAEMGEGLLVTALMGASVNPNTGAYSRGASGFWVEGGEIVYPVSEATIAGALPEMLRSLQAADDPDCHAAYAIPSLRVDGLVVA